MELRSHDIHVEIDTDRGVITSIRDPMEQGGANYLADKPVQYRSDLGSGTCSSATSSSRTWDAGFWALTSTGRSSNVRDVTAQEGPQGCVVRYTTAASRAGILGALRLEERFSARRRHSLMASPDHGCVLRALGDRRAVLPFPLEQ